MHFVWEVPNVVAVAEWRSRKQLWPILQPEEIDQIEW